MTDPILLELPTEFSTERLKIRSYRQGDGKPYFKLIQKNYQHLEEEASEVKKIKNPDDAEIFIRKLIADWITRKRLVLSICDKTSENIIGQIWIEPIKWDFPLLEIGYFIDKENEGTGKVTEAVKACLTFLFEEANALKIEIHCKSTNEKSYRVAERCGFKKEAHLRDRVKTNEGVVGDLLYYGLLRSEYFELKNSN
ncbi:MAG: GNAT family N-acetyltransferase [Candidatus Kariarchaeaceae archaeon]|jgi:RimJ/RimL family protein N-acetyltransferase